METYTSPLFCCLGRRLPFISSYKYTIRFQDLRHASLSNLFSNRTFRHRTKRSFSFHRLPTPPPPLLLRTVFRVSAPSSLSAFIAVQSRSTFSLERVYENSSAFSFHKSSQQSRSSRRLYSNFPAERDRGRREGDKKEREGEVSFNSLIITVFITILCSRVYKIMCN